MPLVVVACLLLAILTACLLRRTPLGSRLAVALCALGGAGIAAGFVIRPRPLPEAEVATRPIESPTDGYVSSTTCRACHPHQYATWHDSYHRQMTQRAGPDSVLGDFDDVTLTRFGKTWQLQRKGDEFWIEMDDPMVQDGGHAGRVRRQASMTTGAHHMQLYWYESGHTRVTGLLPFAWLREEQRWVPRFAVFVMPPSEKISPEWGQWNHVCLKCHATNGRPRVDMDTQGLHGADTRVSEFGIACEACHGPAQDHVAHNRMPTRRYGLHFGDGSDATIVNPASLDHRAASQVCGQCHGNFDDPLKGEALRQWFLHGDQYRPGTDLERLRKVNRAGWDEQFWPDGVIRVAGREFNGLVGSGCYEHGTMSCMSCHQLHQPPDDPRRRDEWANDQLKVGMDGDRACLQCHQDYAADIPAHTRHPVESAGSRCMNCHMPHTSYALLKGVRNHRIASPDVANTVATGRPNACNQCHLDRSLSWTAQHLHDWYGIAQPSLSGDDASIAASVNWTLKGDAAQRALLAWSFGWEAAQQASGSQWMVPYLAQLLDDPYEAVRLIARRSLRRMPGYGDLDHDLVGAPELRTAARQEAMARWRRTMPAPGDGRLAAVLIQPDGSLREDVFQRLLGMRNLRPVLLLE